MVGHSAAASEPFFKFFWKFFTSKAPSPSPLYGSMLKNSNTNIYRPRSTHEDQTKNYLSPFTKFESVFFSFSRIRFQFLWVLCGSPLSLISISGFTHSASSRDFFCVYSLGSVLVWFGDDLCWNFESDVVLLLLVVSDFEQKPQNHDGFGLILMDLGLFGLFKFLKKKCMKVHDEHSWMFIFFFIFLGSWSEKVERER